MQKKNFRLQLIGISELQKIMAHNSVVYHINGKKIMKKHKNESEDGTTLNEMKKEIEIIICFLLNSLERTSTNQ